MKKNLKVLVLAALLVFTASISMAQEWSKVKIIDHRFNRFSNLFLASAGSG